MEKQDENVMLTPIEQVWQSALKDHAEPEHLLAEAIVELAQKGKRCPEYNRRMDHIVYCVVCRTLFREAQAAERLEPTSQAPRRLSWIWLPIPTLVTAAGLTLFGLLPLKTERDQLNSRLQSETRTQAALVSERDEWREKALRPTPAPPTPSPAVALVASPRPQPTPLAVYVYQAAPPQPQPTPSPLRRTDQVALTEISGKTATDIASLMPVGPERGGGEELSNRRIVLLSPVLTAIRERQPILRWKPFAGAARYSVLLILKARVTKSPPIEVEGTSLLLENPLEVGEFYQWEVTALDEAGKEMALSPREEFEVLSQDKIRTAAKATWELEGQHLSLGLTYARLGLREDALREVTLYLREHPNAKPALSLKEALLKPREPSR